MVAFTYFSAAQLLMTSLAAWLAYTIYRTTYHLLFHPLARFPRPKLRGAFHLPEQIEVWKGDLVHNHHALHEKYGDIVRISPDALSVISPEAWKDVYGYANKAPMMKCPEFYYREEHDAADIIAANDRDHVRIRRLLNYAFSEQALRSQESIINSYITLLISKLKRRASQGNSVDIVKYLNFTTFDITGDLSFDESFGALESEEHNEWVATLFTMLRVGAIIRVLTAYGLPTPFLLKYVPPLARAQAAHVNYTKAKTARRLATKTDRKDFLSYILRYNDERGMTHEEIKNTSSILIIAGSETSATLLSGAVYYLLKDPVWMHKLQEELSTTFKTDSQITFASVSQLNILNAIIQETFRLYPPAAAAFPRISPKGGAMVAGTFIPPGVKIGIPQYCANRSSRHFRNPEKYAPERFLGDPEYANDKRSVIQPFSVGPRNCIGQSLAYAEIRTILARLMWHFDFEMSDEIRDWEKQRIFVLWDKPSLMVKLKARQPTA
ncbi:cytochrome P450 monooxygenase-like protein [Paraphoma chrysanthemicola]|nr:cytochrome P450 monooxygenase-like protein [Paraphoma chrysanthemicola]